MPPFLTIVTRCSRRPTLLGKNLISVFRQTDTDLEQVFIPDFEHRGLYWANQQIAENLHRIDGDYVFLLDDDDVMTEFSAVKFLKSVPGQPAVIMVRNSRPQLAPHIMPRVWGRRDALRQVTVCNGSCYVVRADFFKGCAHHFGSKAAGDFSFIRALEGDRNCDFYWLDRVLSESLQLGRSSVEPDCPSDWFQQIVRNYGLVEVGEGDWRLPLWRWSSKRIWLAFHKKAPTVRGSEPLAVTPREKPKSGGHVLDREASR